MGCMESTPIQGGGGVNVAGAGGQQQQKPNKAEAKIVLLGDSGVGKSRIKGMTYEFIQGRFSPFHEVTIGAAFLQQMVRTNDGSNLKLHIWDTGGQERFRAMAPLYYRDAAAAIIVFDCTSADGLETVKYWIKELESKTANCILAVAANKSDVPAEEIKADLDSAKEFCDEKGLVFVQTSAKTGDNVGSIFEEVANKIKSQMNN